MRIAAVRGAQAVQAHYWPHIRPVHLWYSPRALGLSHCVVHSLGGTSVLPVPNQKSIMVLWISAAMQYLTECATYFTQKCHIWGLANNFTISTFLVVNSWSIAQTYAVLGLMFWKPEILASLGFMSTELHNHCGSTDTGQQVTLVPVSLNIVSSQAHRWHLYLYHCGEQFAISWSDVLHLCPPGCAEVSNQTDAIHLGFFILQWIWCFNVRTVCHRLLRDSVLLCHSASEGWHHLPCNLRKIKYLNKFLHGHHHSPKDFPDVVSCYIPHS